MISPATRAGWPGWQTGCRPVGGISCASSSRPRRARSGRWRLPVSSGIGRWGCLGFGPMLGHDVSRRACCGAEPPPSDNPAEEISTQDTYSGRPDARIGWRERREERRSGGGMGRRAGRVATARARDRAGGSTWIGEHGRYGCDLAKTVRQWLLGASEPDCYGSISSVNRLAYDNRHVATACYSLEYGYSKVG